MSYGLLLFLSLWACDDYGAAAKVDTIAAYETYLEDAPSGTKAFMATVRLEELYLDQARADKNLASWDAYLERWPKGVHVDAAKKEREVFLFNWAEARSNSAGWQKFLTEYPSAERRRRAKAKASLRATAFAEKYLKVSEVTSRKINLAEDPEGPLNGTEFSYQVTLAGDQELPSFWYELQFLGKDDVILDRKEWPLVASYAEYPVPVREEKTLPMKPGETRTWEWWSDGEPEGFTGNLRLTPRRMAVPKED
jgi:hypothetical protein